MKYTYIRNSQGIALLAALFVLMVLSILGIGLLTNVDDEIKMNKSAENSEMALKVAEAGIQVARSTFFDSSERDITTTAQLSSIDGFYRGGYFLAQMKSGFQGAEKWVQWRYDEGVTGNNDSSEVSHPVFPVWMTGANGVNGSWTGTGFASFYVKNIYSIVARGTYFSIEDSNGNTVVRAHDEYTGAQKVDRDDKTFPNPLYWNYDKKLKGAIPGVGNVNFAVGMSPMASFSNYTLKTGAAVPVLAQQTLYFTYSGSSTDLSGSADRSSTVRLRASSGLCNYDSGATDNSNPALLDPLWEFDTGLHGTGTAPAFFDPDPGTPGDEILYFAVISQGRAGQSSALNLNSTSTDTFRSYPSRVSEDPEQIYLFAIVDTTIPNATDICNTTGSYRLKWTRPFPDPDVAEWTDYTTEHVTGTDGYDPPYIRVPADMTPFLPEGDLLADYRDGPDNDSQWNHMRGNLLGIMGKDASVSPPVVKVLYRTDNTGSGNLTERREEALDPYEPMIDIYLMYSAYTRVTYLEGSLPFYWNDIKGFHGTGWGPPGYRKPNTAQVRIIALRDRVASVKDGGGNHINWNWNAAQSRYPTFKWSYPVPPWDPDQTYTSPDDRPGNGYGEFKWDTWFEQQIAPMIYTVERNQDLTPWADVGGAGARLGGQENLYTVIYPYYKCVGFVAGTADINDINNGRRGPSTTEGAPINLSGSVNAHSWADSHIMVMAVRDTWDDFIRGDRTNILGTNLDDLNMELSNPFEHYWTHTDDEGVGGATGIPANEQNLITYNSGLNAPYRTNAAKIGFPRPYAWWEALWTANVRGAPSTEPQSLNGQGWETMGASDSTRDLDVEGEVAAMCPQCLFREGLMVISINHDLRTGSCIDTWWGCSEDNDREDLRFHAINPTTGKHVWDYHLPASLVGDDANTTPSIANNLVFVAYQRFGKTATTNREAYLLILDADDGSEKQNMKITSDADAVILPPTIANGAVYVGTYDFNGTFGSANTSNDAIRIFSMSPVLRLVSTGIYPFDYPGARYPYGYQHYTGGAYSFAKITSLDHDKIFQNPTGELRGLWKRKLQVWITGQNSKWEEVREVLEE
jgi:hypothetical protein